MSKLNFEEYRQKWETGPHWELKKEFLETYQDDFPEDRLLCLAQAYSNIELMHCSYPEPVMRQIHELSKNLHARKRLQEEQDASQGKRCFPEEVSEKPYKFIKFCSSVDSPILKEPSNECKTSVEDVIPISLVQSHASSSSPEQINPVPATLNDDITNDFNYLFLIHASPDFPLISKIADKIKTLSSDVQRNTPLAKIELAIEYLDVKSRASFKFKKYNNSSVCASDFYVARMYVGDTLIALGRSNNERNAAINAAEYAIEVFRNLSLLPKVSLDQTSIHDHSLLVRFANEMEKRIADKVDSSSKQIASAVRAVKQKLQMEQESFHFNFREDMLSSLNHRLYFSDFVIMNVWISDGKSTKKKRANNEATQQGYLKLLEELNSGHKVISQTEVNSDILPPSSAMTVTTQNHPSSSSDKDTTSSNHKQNKASENHNVTSSISEQKVFHLNHYLLRNSLEKCFALFDMSELEHQKSQLTPGARLNAAVGYCHNVLSYEFETITNPTSNGSQFTLHKCFVILDQEIVGTGQDTTTTLAKKAAVENALDNLRKRFYTIKVKNEKEDGFIITRDQVMNLYESSKVVPESNVGHKMLKMMGWSGGSIGKSGGITEPIEASGQHFHQGLGFINNNVIVKEFKKKIETLIKDYNVSDTVTDMIFSTDFTKEERKQIHEVATKYRLNSNSYGKGNERQIHVRHKNLPINELLQRLVEAKGSLPKYELSDQSDF